MTIKAIFDELKYINDLDLKKFPNKFQDDIKKCHDFIRSYSGRQTTFNAYRREIEKLVQWCMLQDLNLKDLRRDDLEKYIKFFKKPPKKMIMASKFPKFLNKDDARVPNPNWKPFLPITISSSSIADMLRILSSLFNFLIADLYLNLNPVSLIRQKHKYLSSNENEKVIRKINARQLKYLITAAKKLKISSPKRHTRTLFMLYMLYGLYLRISELAANEQWSPRMNHFFQDEKDNWWFKTMGKGKKLRRIACSDDMIKELKNYRTELGMAELPSASDRRYIFLKQKTKLPLTSITYIRELINECFKVAKYDLLQDGFSVDANEIDHATAHWLRHTGISNDVKIRPREHVRDDAGHGSGMITDRYIDVELDERYKSAKNKLLEPES